MFKRLLITAVALAGFSCGSYQPRSTGASEFIPASSAISLVSDQPTLACPAYTHEVTRVDSETSDDDNLPPPPRYYHGHHAFPLWHWDVRGVFLIFFGSAALRWMRRRPARPAVKTVVNTCPKCARRLTGIERFCPRCGASLIA